MSKSLLMILSFIVLTLSGVAQTIEGAAPATTHFIPGTTSSEAGALTAMVVTISPDIKPTIGGKPLVAGDEIGAFSAKGVCAGAAVWTATAAMKLEIIGVAANPSNANPNALHSDEQIFFKVWSKAEQKEAPATVTWAAGYNGMYSSGSQDKALATLTATSPINASILPKAGTVYKVGDKVTLTWTGVKNSRIELLISDKATDITNAVKSGVWTIGENGLNQGLETKCQIRISDNSDQKILGVTSEIFTIASTIAVTQPTDLLAETQQQIVFTTAGKIGKVSVQYFNGTKWNVIQNNLTANSGKNTVSFTPAAADISNKCLIQVACVSATTPAPKDNPADTSKAFTIYPKITITNPISKPSWVGNTTQKITWTTNSQTDINIDFTVNGNSWTTLKKVASNSSPYSWVVPNTPSANCQIRISAASLNNVGAVSAAFIITAAPTVTLTQIKETNFAVGDKYAIAWKATGTVAQVNLDYRFGQKGDWKKIGSGAINNTGSYTWTIPNELTDSCRVRVSVTGSPTIFDSSASYFKIIAPSLKILTPKKGDKLTAGTAKYLITWQPDGVADVNNNNVKIEVSTDNKTWNIIAASRSNLPNDSGKCSFSWTIPDTIVSFDSCRLKISQVNGNGLPKDSVVYFRIGAKTDPTITIITPNGGKNEKYITGSSLPMSWGTNGLIDSVKLEYKINSTDWRLISKSVNGAKGGIYTWQIPDTLTPSKTCKVRITALNILEKVSDTSSADFEIALPSITITKPKVNDYINATKSDTITWTADSIITKVTIEYSLNNGASWKMLKDSVASAKGGKFIWTAPDSLSDSCKIKISMTGRPVVTTTSSLFSIVSAPKISLATPNGKENFVEGSKASIAWGSFDIDGLLKIEYTKDNGKNWSLIKDSVKVADLSYTWIVPAIKSDSCKVRISSLVITSISDMSDSVFSIDLQTKIQVLPAKACLLGAGIKASKMGFNLTIGSPKSILVSARIMNLQGREIMSLSSRSFSAGYHTLSISSPSLNNGFYIAEVNLGGTIVRKSVSFVK